MQQQKTGGQPTYRFNDAESGCHLSAALTVAPGTENKHTHTKPKQKNVKVFTSHQAVFFSVLVNKREGEEKENRKAIFCSQRAILCARDALPLRSVRLF